MTSSTTSSSPAATSTSITRIGTTAAVSIGAALGAFVLGILVGLSFFMYRRGQRSVRAACKDCEAREAQERARTSPVGGGVSMAETVGRYASYETTTAAAEGFLAEPLRPRSFQPERPSPVLLSPRPLRSELGGRYLVELPGAGR